MTKSYHIGRELGYGRFGIVRLAQKKSFEHKRFAVKSISRSQTASQELSNSEFEILKSVDHPNIIKFYEMYTDDKNYHLVTEFCGGGELFEHIICKGSFNELQASKVVK